jgi:hypothetical protein
MTISLRVSFVIRIRWKMGRKERRKEGCGYCGGGLADEIKGERDINPPPVWVAWNSRDTRASLLAGSQGGRSMRNRWEDEKIPIGSGKIDKNENLLLSLSHDDIHTPFESTGIVCAPTAPLYKWRRCWIELRKTRRRPKALALGNRPRWKTTRYIRTRYIRTRLWVYSMCVGSNRNKTARSSSPISSRERKM